MIVCRWLSDFVDAKYVQATPLAVSASTWFCIKAAHSSQDTWLHMCQAGDKQGCKIESQGSKCHSPIRGETTRTVPCLASAGRQ